MLLETIDIPTLPQTLLPRDKWRPFPTVDDRDAWQKLQQDPSKKAYCDAMLAAAKQAADQPWPALPATLYARFARDGNRDEYQKPYFNRRHRLGLYTLALCLEDTDAWRDHVVDALWSICEESSWCLPAHDGLKPERQLPDVYQPGVDLFAAESAMVMAECISLVASRIEPISPQLVHRVNQNVIDRVITPTETHDWGWFEGRNNWTPWCACNVLTAAGYTLDDNQRLANLVVRLGLAIDKYIDKAPSDGGSDEGPSYWNVGHLMLAGFLDLLHERSQGKIDIFNQPLIKAMGQYIIKAHIHGDWFANFADGPARKVLRHSMVKRFAMRTGDHAVYQFAKQQEKRHPIINPTGASGILIYTMLRDLWWADQPPAEAAPVEDASDPLADTATFHWLPHLQILNARSHAQTDRGLCLLAKGGHNHENHNHNDVGHFMLYQQGQPVIVDAGVGMYTRDTFNHQKRYQIWAIRGSGHNAPIINDIEQAFGQQYRAADVHVHNEPANASLALNLNQAYPAEAGVKKLVRTMKLHRDDTQPHASMTDEYTLSSADGKLQINLLTPCEVVIESDGRVRFTGDGRAIEMSFKPGALDVAIEHQPIAPGDGPLYQSWGESLTRVVLTHHAREPQGQYRLTFRPKK